VAGGELVGVDDYGGPSGTTVDVRGLFFNTPARRKFMRAPATEQAHVVEAALRVALGARRGGVVVGSGTRRLLDIPEDQSEVERVKAALGPRVRELIAFQHAGDGVRVSGYVTPLDTLRNDTKGTWFFVNGRFVRERLLPRAQIEVFRPHLPAGRYPLAVVYIDVDATAVDVNVHPQKLEVRFSDSSAVYRSVTSALTELFVSGAFSQREAFPMLDGARSATKRFMSRAHESPSASSYHPTASTQGQFARPDVGREVPFNGGDYRPPALQQELPEPKRLSDARRWVLREREGTVLLVDVEQVVRGEIEEALRDAVTPGHSAEAVELVLPEVVEVDEATEKQLELEEGVLARFGLEFGAIGPGRTALRSVPKSLGGTPARAIAEAVLALDRIDAPSVLQTLIAVARAPSEEDRTRWVTRALKSGADGKRVFELSDAELRRMLLHR
ncbi:MAG: hypothetical protein AAF658_19225, partial [Myxococcota bacterium]